MEFNIKFNTILKFCCAYFFSFGFLLCGSFAEAQSNYELCLEKSNDPSCNFFFIRREHTSSYNRPDFNSKYITYYEAPGLLLSTSWDENRKHKGWFFYPYNKKDIIKFGLRNKGEWLRQEDMAGARDFKRVIGCWPIMGFEAPEFFSVTTTPEGKAYLGGGKWGSDGKVYELYPTKYPTNIWFTENLVRFGDHLVPDWKNNSETDVFGYDPKSKALGESVSQHSVTYYPQDKLAGCENGLKLEEHNSGK